MNHSETLSELTVALNESQAELKNPLASSIADTGKFRYSYAPLDDILTDVRNILTRHGLALIQEAETGQGAVGVRTIITHVSGQWIELGPLVLPAGDTAQACGSALTYARRYALCAALGIAADDDDDARTSAQEQDRSDASSSRAGGAERGAGGVALSAPASPATSSERGPGSHSDPEAGGARQPDAVYGEVATSGEGNPQSPATSDGRREKLWRQLVEFAGTEAKARNEINRRLKAGWTASNTASIPEDDIEKTLVAVLQEAG